MRKKFSLILQRDSMQCGASCLAMICSYFEKNKCIEYLSEQCFATTEGVSLPYWTRRYVSGCISVPIPCRTIAIGRLYPTRSLIVKFSTFIEISGQISCNLKKKDYFRENNNKICL